VLFSLPSHADNGVLVGAGMGAALGAVVGHQINHDSGAWVGGAVGAVTGAAIASSNNNNVRYVERGSYYNNAYNGNVRRDVYVVDQYGSYRRPPVNVIYVDSHRSYGHHHGHGHDRDNWRGYNDNRWDNSYYSNGR
jgi:outer membrane lipoprotein SlyB